jgi:excisionase family DNA binding protein
LGTVQQMVENGQLEGWKTAGGHRRIRVSSIEEFRARSMAGGGQNHQRQPANSLQVLVAEDDRILQKLYEHTLASWGLPLSIRLVSSGIDGLLEIGRVPPDLLITDLRMPGIDGFEMIRRLRADPQLQELDIVVVSGLTEEEIRKRRLAARCHLLLQTGSVPRTERLRAGQDHGHAAPRASRLSPLLDRAGPRIAPAGFFSPLFCQTARPFG